LNSDSGSREWELGAARDDSQWRTAKHHSFPSQKPQRYFREVFVVDPKA
jgi:hypothetical protein